MPDAIVLSVLARSILAGAPTPEGIVERAQRTLGGSARAWLGPVAETYIQAFSDQTRPRHRDVVEFVRNDPDYRRARSEHKKPFPIAEWLMEPAVMEPVPSAAPWNLPQIATSGDLAERLGVTIGELEWFADLKALTYKSRDPKLRHYHYRSY